jgi:hypothetical protein
MFEHDDLPFNQTDSDIRLHEATIHFDQLLLLLDQLEILFLQNDIRYSSINHLHELFQLVLVLHASTTILNFKGVELMLKGGFQLLNQGTSL